MIFFLCMLSFALAEPPVGDSYLEAAQSLRNHGPQQYIPDLTAPAARHQAPTHDQHAVPTSRVSQEYAAPEFRDNLSQVYGIPRQESSFRSEEYGDTSFAEQRFSSPLKSGIAQRYGAPSRNLPSGSYGLPSRSLTQYGVPEISDSSRSSARTISPVQKYGVPKFQSRKPVSNFGHDTSNDVPSFNTYQSARSFPQQNQRLSSRYGAPQVRNVGTEQSEQRYGAHDTRSLSQYGQPKSNGLKTNAYTSSYSTLKSQGYGVPQREAMPSSEYGAPDALADQGYQYARNALDLLNQEPANYEFAYKVEDYESGSDFGHVETRQEGKAEGAYFVVLPDGSKQIVEYEADEDGFKPRISVEPAHPETRNAEGSY